ncbi:hypothetical protein Peur_036419 [Populus x canadensis]
MASQQSPLSHWHFSFELNTTGFHIDNRARPLSHTFLLLQFSSHHHCLFLVCTMDLSSLSRSLRYHQYPGNNGTNITTVYFTRAPPGNHKRHANYNIYDCKLC